MRNDEIDDVIEPIPVKELGLMTTWMTTTMMMTI
jgi:hypothetical protein